MYCQFLYSCLYCTGFENSAKPGNKFAFLFPGLKFQLLHETPSTVTEITPNNLMFGKRTCPSVFDVGFRCIKSIPDEIQIPHVLASLFTRSKRLLISLHETFTKFPSRRIADLFAVLERSFAISNSPFLRVLATRKLFLRLRYLRFFTFLFTWNFFTGRIFSRNMIRWIIFLFYRRFAETVNVSR